MHKRTPLLIVGCVALMALPLLATAAPISLNLPDMGSTPGTHMLQLLAMITILSLAPSIVVMMTAFTRIVVVLSFLRHAMGLQQAPPNVVIVSLALFLTLFTMQPVLEKSYDEGLGPWFEKKIDEKEAWDKSIYPLKEFMIHQTRPKDLQLFVNIAKLPPAEVADLHKLPLRVLTPAFMISELRRAFEIGFMLFIPFLVIDMVIASILMSMGMMMLPPVMISMPFKIIFFVLVDGWRLVAGSLIESFG